MADDMISKPRARRVRLVSQLVTVVFAAGAAGAVVIGLPFQGATAPDEVPFEQVEAKAEEMYRDIMDRRSSNEQTVDELPVDLQLIQGALASIANHPTIAPPPGAGGQGTGKGTDKPVAAEGKTRFLGTIAIGDRLLALVSAGGSQRVMGAGDKATLALPDGDSGSPPTVEIRSVNRESVVLVENGAERRVERAPRSGAAVTTSVASVAPKREPSARDAAAAASGGAFAEPEQIPPVNPDDFRREDGTIDYEALREAARERARQRQELRRQRRDERGEDN